MLYEVITSGSGKTLSLATLNEYKISRTDITFTDEVEDLDVGASNKPIRCRRFEGNALCVITSYSIHYTKLYDLRAAEHRHDGFW